MFKKPYISQERINAQYRLLSTRIDPRLPTPETLTWRQIRIILSAERQKRMWDELDKNSRRSLAELDKLLAETERQFIALHSGKNDNGHKAAEEEKNPIDKGTNLCVDESTKRLIEQKVAEEKVKLINKIGSNLGDVTDVIALAEMTEEDYNKLVRIANSNSEGSVFI